MATRRAIANGNWSATGTWNGGVVPGNGDTVYANGFNVTLDQDITIGGENNPIVNTGSLVSGQWYEIVSVGGQGWTGIGAASNTTGTVFLATGTGTAGNLGTARALATLTTATNTAAGATTGGGVFTMSTVRAMNCDLRAGTTTCLNVTATTGTLVLAGIRAIGGSVTGAHASNNNSTATVELANGTFIGGAAGCNSINNNSTGSVIVSQASSFTGGSGTAAFAINNAASGTVTISASSSFTGGGANGHALSNTGTGNILVSASCTFTAGVNTAIGLNNASTGSVSISGPSTFNGGGNVTSPAVQNASVGSIVIEKGTFVASAFANAVNIANSSADVRLSGDFLDHWSGWKAVSGAKWRLGTTPSAARTRYALDGTTDSYVEMFTADNATFGQPAIADVRSGTIYGGGILTGTCAVPAASSVAFGVPVDNTTGTAVLTEANVQAAVWNTLTSSLTTAGSIGERLKNSATVATTGEQLATALTAP